MGKEGSPDFHEGKAAITEIARAELMAGLFEDKAMLIQEEMSEAIARNPDLDTMLSRLIESGAELDPAVSDHLRRMVALWIGGHAEAITEAQGDATFFEIAIEHVQGELDEMAAFETDLSDLPDLWDMAYFDLLDLEGQAE